MPGKKHISFIINPVAGGKKKGNLEKYLRDNMAGHSFSYTVSYSEYPGQAFEIAKKHLEEEYDIMVAVGGDGTINEVARALVRTGKPLGIIPSGSGNGFARHFNIPLNFKMALDLILKGKEELIDMANVNESNYFCTSGVGVDADTGYYFSKFKKRGFFSYGMSFLKALREFHPNTYKLLVDGELIETEAFFINVANISQFGYHFYVAPKASAQDGFLDLVIMKRFPWWRAPGLLLKSFSGKIDKSRYFFTKKAKEITLKEPAGRKIMHIDGEPLVNEGEMKFGIEPACLKIIIS